MKMSSHESVPENRWKLGQRGKKEVAKNEKLTDTTQADEVFRFFGRERYEENRKIVHPSVLKEKD